MSSVAIAPARRRWWLDLVRYGRPHWKGLTLLFLMMCLNAALAALGPWPMKLIVDHLLIDSSLSDVARWLTRLPGVEGGGPGSRGALLAWLASFTVLLFLAGQGLTVMRSQLGIIVGQGMIRALRMRVFQHLQVLSLRFHGHHPTGDLIRRVMKDCACVRELLINVVLARLAAVVRAATMFVVMWQLDRTLASIVLLTGLPLGIISRLFSRGMTVRAAEEQRLDGEMTALAEQTLTVLPAVQGFGREELGDQQFVGLTRRTLQATLRTTMSQLQFQFATGGVRTGATAAIMLVGGAHALDGSLSVGSLLIFLAYFNSMMGPLEGLAYATIGFASAAAGANRVFEILDSEDVVRDAPGAEPLPVRGTGRTIRLEGVVFGYEPGRPVLHGVSLEARPGEMVALVGATGAGKSTLVGMVPRFFDPWEGRVTVDGIDVREVQLSSLRAEVSLVLQESFILPLSIADNIAYGRPEADRSEIEASARAANAHEFIERLPQGYDTVVGERGATLSGGERQRLAIARAFLRDSPILILDEPTSALDAGTESLILGALERLMRGRTVLVIAHRLSTVRRADRIVVLDHGRIAEQGTHDELLALGGLYRKFFHLQHSHQATPHVA